MDCLVLGGGGFIGSHVVDHLARAGHRVRLLDLRPNPHADPPAGVECIWADWTDAPALDRALTGVKAVVHLIGTTWPGRGDGNWAADVRGELAASIRLFQACADNGVRRVVFLSSGGTVYGIPSRIPINEDHPTRPICAYGGLKLAIEHYLHLSHHVSGLEYVILRGANVYGERHDLNRSQGAVNVFLRRLARNEPIELWGDGRVIRDYLYVGDLVRAIGLALTTPLQAGVFNVGSGQGVALTDLLAACAVETGLTPQIQVRPGRGCDVPANVLAIDRIRAELGWRPEVTLADGLARTWRWTKSALAEQAQPGRD